ncbi:MAG: hypothetical protein MJE66_23590 [Proteobacteria bacterium]|nr:hypothetical protein [Pseudomonadota bacterium]
MTPEAAATTYTNWELFWYLGGFLLWGAAYVVILFKIHKFKYVEIPAFAVCGNITWEFLWGFYWKVEMFGQTLQWFYRLGALLDVVILIALFCYGAKQVTTPEIKRYFAPFVVASLVGWTAFYLGFVGQGYDLPLGSNSAYVVNVVMSILYTLLVLRANDVAPFSYSIGWLKGVGTAMVTVFVFLNYPDNHFVQIMGVMAGLLDGLYLYVLWTRKRAAARQEAPARAASLGDVPVPA